MRAKNNHDTKKNYSSLFWIMEVTDIDLKSYRPGLVEAVYFHVWKSIARSDVED